MSSKFIVLVITSFVAFLTPFMGSSLNLALPHIGKEFMVSVKELTWVNIIFTLSSAATLIPIGFLADNFGKKKFLNIGLFLFGVVSLLAGFSFNIIYLFIMRALQGVAAAMVFATSMPILLSYFGPTERGKVLGINVAGVYLGLSLGPVIGGLVVQYLNWRWIFLIMVPIILLVAIISTFYIKKSVRKVTIISLDIKEILLYIFSISFFTYGLASFSSLDGKVFCIIGLFCFLIFLFVEAQKPHPIFPLKMFISNYSFLASNLAALINYSATFGISFLLSIYLQNIQNVDPQIVGVILISHPILQTLVSPIAGRLSDHFSPKNIASLGMFISSLSLFAFAFLNTNTSILIIVIILIMLGISFGLFSSPNTNAVMSSVSEEIYSVASSTLGTMRLLGQLTSMAIISLVFSYFLSSVPLAHSDPLLLLKSIKFLFLIFGTLCLLGIVPSFSCHK